MSPTFTFIFGLLLLGLFAWYFMTDAAGRKRNIGLALTLLLLAFCLEAILVAFRVLGGFTAVKACCVGSEI